MYILAIDLYSDNLFTIQNLLNFILFLTLTFIGVVSRISIDIEIGKKKFKDMKFFHRYLLATVLSYVMEFYIVERPSLKKYYSEIIIFFCIFVNDLVLFVFNNKRKLLIYILSIVTKGFIDLRDSIVNKKNGTR